MPVVFLGHGSPMTAIDENQFVSGFRNLSGSIPRPEAILCISAHWNTRGTKVTAMKNPRTIHDFGGFPQALYEVQYPAPGDPALAEKVRGLLTPVFVEPDETWGLDHGAWSVIKHMYPDADVPVVQLSIDYTRPAIYHYNLAQKLGALRDNGILIIGSGNIVHNLRLVDFQNLNNDDYGFDWARDARDIINQYLINGDHEALIFYEKLPPSVQLAIPSPDHYLPLIYTLGLKQSGDEVSLFNDKLVGGSLSMTSVKLG
ncbi:MAG: 4,5-DOPA dioxygenase extradiol [Bacteroidetes bacterium HGW-Bacteroidetes-22]|nr:MAG: 4,5-DOPA dioxygenase extradiol [Bacteroidetes bacterium HGW-Bacteroidetes-22]